VAALKSSDVVSKDALMERFILGFSIRNYTDRLRSIFASFMHLLLAFVVLGLVSSLVAGKNVSEISYSVSSRT